MDTTSAQGNAFHPSPSANSQAVPQEVHRVLFGWAEKEWAIHMRASLLPDTPENHAKAYAEAQAHLAQRPAFMPSSPVTELGDHELVQGIRARPEFSYIQTEVQRVDPMGHCRIVAIDLSEVLALQPSVRVDNLQSRLFQSAPSDEKLFALCLPPNEASETVSIETNERGYTVTTLDPNVRVVPWGHLPKNPPLALPQYQLHYPAASSSLPLQLFPFVLLRVPNYLQVVHYQDRYILRNGYNRAAALLYQGIHTVPCLLIETQEEALVGFKPGMLEPDIVLGDCPPRLSDFWQDTVACLWRTASKRRIYHMTLEEIKVPR